MHRPGAMGADRNLSAAQSQRRHRRDPQATRRVALCLLGLAGLAGANVAEAASLITVTDPTAKTKLNIENCPDEGFSFDVTFQSAGSNLFLGGAPYEIWLMRGSGCSDDSGDPTDMLEVSCRTNTDCCETLAAGDLGGTEGMLLTEAETVTVSVDLIADFFDCSVAEDGSFKIVVFTQPGAISDSLSLLGYEPSTDWTSESISVKYDFERPPRPSNAPTVKAGETSLQVKWTAVDEDTTRYVAYATVSEVDPDLPVDQQSLEDLQSTGTIDAGKQEGRISGLRADQIYNVVLVYIDEADNKSLPSPAVTVEPVDVLDFYEYYRSMGGAETGGYCQTTAGGPAGAWWSLLPLLGLLWLRRRTPATGPTRSRRRRLLVLPLLLALSLPAATAAAESPRIMTFALSGGTYEPGIDQEWHSSAVGPYATFFGGEAPLLLRGDFGWNLFTGAGTMTAGFGLGYGSVEAQGLVADPATGGSSGSRAVDESERRLLPLSVSLTYAFDLLAEHLSLPLVPFGSVGLDYCMWWIYDGEGELATTPESKGEGKGGTAGFHFSVGLRLLLDFFAPDMASTFDLDMGVNNTYLFAEYLMTEINDFGDRSSINLSGNSLSFGIAFDF